MSSDAELWQGYTEQGEPLTTEGVTRRATREDGTLHGAAHLWIWKREGGATSFLLQERSKTKLTWPGFHDISAAGHIDFGETPLQAMLRELAEELGLSPAPELLNLLFVYRAYMVDTSSGVIENEFQWVYGLDFNKLPALNTVKLEDGEVDSTRWISGADFKAMIAGKSEAKIVPHGSGYFTNLFEAVNRLNHENH